MKLNANKNLKKVLVIENDEFNICVTGSFLYACGFPEVIVARTDKEAIEKLSDRIAFVLLSIDSTICSGLETYRELRRTQRGKTIPVIALAPKGKRIKIKCIKSGMRGVMTKPVRFNEFKSGISRSLGFIDTENL